MKILGWIIVIPVVLFVLLIVARVAFCGPNSSDVKVMKPMAEKISDYIVKNGIPESLEDIPDLPYGLEGCSKPQDNVEDCYFFIKKVSHDLRLYEVAGSLSVEIENRVTETGIYVELRRNNKKSKWFFVEEKSFSSKTSGICNPMKQ
jgi:hypothetical protein